MSRRTYAQYCGLAQALDVVGERWTLLIVRELLGGPKRYSDLVDGLSGIGTSLLAERLRHLEDEGVIARAYLPPPAASTVYELTEDGRDLAEAMHPLTVWGARRLGKPKRGETVRLEWIMRFMEATYDRAAAEGLRETYEFRLPPGTFHVRLDDGDVTFHEGSADAPDLVVETDLDTFIGLGTGRVNPLEARASERLRTEGSDAVAGRSLAVFGGGLARRDAG